MRKFSAFLSLVLALVVGTSRPTAAQTGDVLRTRTAQTTNTKQVQHVINQVTPSSGVVGASVTVSGNNFGSTQGSSIITFNGIPASVTKWTNWTILANVPAGASSGNVVVNVAGSPTNGVNFAVVTVATRSLIVPNFGFQCGFAIGNCGGRGGTLVWPSTQTPGSLRLHDASTSWSDLSTGPGAYDWTRLDNWLDMIAQHRPLPVIEVFSWVPCWDANTCEAPTVAPTGTNTPPLDLTANGSRAFTEFVTQFVQHCSAAGNCVGNCPAGKTCASANLIRFYEMWNEWNTNVRWAGTAAQLYQMIAPAVPIIRANVANAVILTPSTTSGNADVFTSWLNLEAANGRLSDWVDWHDYLSGNTPEDEWAQHSSIYLSNQVSLAAWKNIPWADTETSFDTQTYACPPKFNAEDCAGQIVRWHLLHASNGAKNINWYKWNQTIGSSSKYQTTYHWMMQYLTGGKFVGPCASNGGTTPTWTCSFTQTGGKASLWIWTPSEKGTSYVVPSGYADYLDLTGAKTPVYRGQSLPVNTIPILLE